MFFIRVPNSRSMDAAADRDCLPATDQMGASVRFEGHPSGALSIAMDARLARGIAEDFLGVQDIAFQQVEDVVRELANITCGAVLSRIESECTFRLDSPRSGMDAPDAQSEPAATWDFPLGTQPVTVKLWMESARCQSTDQSGS
jgi:chemotaxis protein CheY-P-specific phosphatase CheC